MQKCMGSLSVVEDNFGSGRLFIGPKTMVGERASEVEGEPLPFLLAVRASYLRFALVPRPFLIWIKYVARCGRIASVLQLDYGMESEERVRISPPDFQFHAAQIRIPPRRENRAFHTHLQICWVPQVFPSRRFPCSAHDLQKFGQKKSSSPSTIKCSCQSLTAKKGMQCNENLQKHFPKPCPKDVKMMF